MKLERLIFFDTETTGLSPDNGDRIVEIGCIEMINGVLTENHFHHYINPERNIPENVVKIHGITNAKVRHAPKFHEIGEKFLNYIKGAILVAHNASFDIKFLNSELRRMKLAIISNKVEDTLKIAKAKFPGSPASLDALCKRFAVDLKERDFHGALLDSKLLACVYRKMVMNEQIDFNFEKSISEMNQNIESNLKLKNRINPAIVDAEEIQNHIDFLKSFSKETLWIKLGLIKIDDDI